MDLHTLPNCIPQTSETVKVVVTKELYSLLCSVTENMPFVTTYNEVVKNLCAYVYKRRLFDVNKPVIIRCEGDDLSKIFGVKEFSVPEVGKYLSKLVFPLSVPPGTHTKGCISNRELTASKRKFEGSDGEHPVFSDNLKPTSLYENQSDSALSIQGYETAIVKDTSDDELHFFEDYQHKDREMEYRAGDLVTIAETFDIEYEVESASSTDSDDSDSSDSDDSDLLHQAILSFVCKTDSDVEFFADGSEASSEDLSSEDNLPYWDAEINDADRWLCKSCGFAENSPAMGCCGKCWKNRSGWWSSETHTKGTKPKRCRKRKKVEHDPSQTKEIFKEKDSFPSTSEGKTECQLCCNNAINSSIIHGKTSHRISCYSCSKKLYKKGSTCPICRRKIQRVVKEMS